MKRREFLTKFFASTALLAAPSTTLFASNAEYNGRILVTFEANGGWDVTAFCDPKMNIPGEKKITHWSESDETQTVGGIDYAPFANNSSFFKKYHNQMLVINGIDAQTNSHETGIIHNWSGRTAEGYPSLGALFSASYNADSPLAYLSTVTYNQTANLIRFNRIFEPKNLLNLGVPDIYAPGQEWGNQPYRNQNSLDRIRHYRQARLEKMMSNASIIGRNRHTLEAYSDAIAGQHALRRVIQYIPENTNGWGPKSQIDAAVVGIRAGLLAAADFQVNGDSGNFDSHDNNDSAQTVALSYMTDIVDYLWEQAEIHGFADRLTVIMGSEFGRTPHYNSQDGKDHWPIGSMVIMEKNASWTNRAVGLTDEGHNAHKINPFTLERDDSNGTVIYPKHVHKALRKHLGIDSFAESKGFGIPTEEFNFFS